MTSKQPSKLIDCDGDPVGSVLSDMPFVVNEYVGTAKSENGTYELYFNLSIRTPMIKNKDTGKVCVFDWNDLVSLARTAGLDK